MPPTPPIRCRQFDTFPGPVLNSAHCMSLIWTPSGGIQGVDLLSGSTVEILHLTRHGGGYHVETAVDGVKLEPFWEPDDHTVGMSEDDLIQHLKEQAVGWAETLREMGRLPS